MTKRYDHIILFISLASAFISCSITEDPNPVDTKFHSINIHHAAISPSVVNTDTIFVNGGTATTDDITVNTVVTVKASERGKTITLSSTAYNLARSLSFGSGTLRDDGIAPDLAANDSIYSGNLTVTFKRSLFGNLNIVISGGDGSNGTNSIILPFTVTRFNTPPALSELSCPDTVFVPQGNNVSLIHVSITARDLQGSLDIKFVKLEALRANGSSTGNFELYDDGGVGNKFFGIPSGDSLATDGRYTLDIPLSSTTDTSLAQNKYRDFLFFAQDFSNAISDTIFKRVYIK